MPRSKLEFYEDILVALANKPLTIDAIAYKCKMECVILTQRIDFLLKHNLVGAVVYNSRKHYELTRRGTAIYKTLCIAKRLEKLQTTIDKAIPPLSAVSEQNHRKSIA